VELIPKFEFKIQIRNFLASKGRAILNIIAHYFDLDRILGNLIISLNIFQIDFPEYKSKDFQKILGRIIYIINYIPGFGSHAR